MEQLSRIDARIPLPLREMIDFAASLEGRTRTDFLISAASERARQVIAEHRSIQLSLRDQKMLADAFLNDAVREPDDFLKGIREEYHAQVKPR